jgi:hypothetical protein
LVTAIQAPRGGFLRLYDFVSDDEYADLTIEQLQTLIADGSHRILYVVDQRAITDPEHPVLVLDVSEEPGRAFRVVPAAMQTVDRNILELEDLDFALFEEFADPDGIFRGIDPRRHGYIEAP